jgi:hypothetical protein
MVMVVTVLASCFSRSQQRMPRSRVAGFLHPRRDVPLALQHTPDIDVVGVLNVEDEVGVTGVKRDIALLERVRAGAGDRVTVLDVSMEKNRGPLDRLLADGAEVLYIDHHFAGELPVAPRLTALINEAPEICTSLLVNGRLKGRFGRWAVVGAFGDNLDRSARALARQLDVTEEELERMAELGTYMNYNGYGERVEDLYFTPDELFRLVSAHVDPLHFIRDGRVHFERLRNGYHADIAAADAVQPVRANDRIAVFILPDLRWARRVSGVYGNALTNRHPGRAHAVLTEKADGSFLVSVRLRLRNASKRPGHYLPVNRGLRFSFTAALPSA